MQVVSSDAYSGTLNSYQNLSTTGDAKLSSNALVVSNILQTSPSEEADINVGFQDLYKSLTITAKQIVDKLNEILKSKLPDGLQSLKPEDVTPEATAQNVASGVTAFFGAFAKQNSDLSPDELVKKFIEEAKKGVEKGYGDAKQILGDLGAFEFDGVENGISQTKDLIMQKLDKFAEQKLEELNGKAVASNTTDITKTALLEQSGGRVLDLRV